MRTHVLVWYWGICIRMTDYDYDYVWVVAVVLVVVVTQSVLLFTEFSKLRFREKWKCVDVFMYTYRESWKRGQNAENTAVCVSAQTEFIRSMK